MCASAANMAQDVSDDFEDVQAMESNNERQNNGNLSSCSSSSTT